MKTKNLISEVSRIHEIMGLSSNTMLLTENTALLLKTLPASVKRKAITLSDDVIESVFKPLFNSKPIAPELRQAAEEAAKKGLRMSDDLIEWFGRSGTVDDLVKLIIKTDAVPQLRTTINNATAGIKANINVGKEVPAAYVDALKATYDDFLDNLTWMSDDLRVAMRTNFDNEVNIILSNARPAAGAAAREAGDDLGKHLIPDPKTPDEFINNLAHSWPGSLKDLEKALVGAFGDDIGKKWYSMVYDTTADPIKLMLDPKLNKELRLKFQNPNAALEEIKGLLSANSLEDLARGTRFEQLVAKVIKDEGLWKNFKNMSLKNQIMSLLGMLNAKSIVSLVGTALAGIAWLAYKGDLFTSSVTDETKSRDYKTVQLSVGLNKHNVEDWFKNTYPDLYNSGTYDDTYTFSPVSGSKDKGSLVRNDGTYIYELGLKEADDNIPNFVRDPDYEVVLTKEIDLRNNANQQGN